MGKKILVPCFDVYNDRHFPGKYTVKDHISNTKLEKGDHYYIQTRHKDLFSHYNLILRKLYEKMSRKALENTNEIRSCPPGHPIILLKSNQFNMAAVSVKRSIICHRLTRIIYLMEFEFRLRTVRTIVAAHIFCACQGSRA